MSHPIELPPKYYLSHFQEFVLVLREQLQHLLDESHLTFLNQFGLLSEEAQCLYVRMVNRKGILFTKEEMSYAEITDQARALSELQAFGFAEALRAEHIPAAIYKMTKAEVLKRLQRFDLLPDKKAPKQELAERLKSLQLDLSHFTPEKFIIQGKSSELNYLLFLFFGKIQNSLSLYTLRDLGIKKTNAQKKFAARFSSAQEACVEYFYALLRHQLREQSLASVPELSSWPLAQSAEAKSDREWILCHLGDEARRAEELEQALAYFSACAGHPGREKCARLLYQLNRLDECKELLEQLMQDPQSDEEYLFAEDFMARKFQGKRISHLTETLRSSRKILIDESFYRKPESGVLIQLKNDGYLAWHGENYLWNSLFGIMFWHELFEGENTHHNEFDLAPHDLVTGKFYCNHLEAIERKLSLLGTPEMENYLNQILEQKADTPNGVFGWHESLKEMLTLFLQAANPESVKQMLRYLAQDYLNRSTGFPDVLAIKDHDLSFYEVKAEGDSLKSSQLKQILALRNAGFQVEVLQVAYNVNPDQTYVVVDLETTGGVASLHRITEIGAVKIKNGILIDQYQTLINPERPIPMMIQQLTGITNEMVKDAPKFAEAADSFLAFAEDCIFVAHNVAFDYGFLQMEFERLEKKFTMPYICTKAWSRKHFPGLESYGLKNLSQHFSISLVNHHRALSDAQAAAQILMHINEKRRERLNDASTLPRGSGGAL